MNENEIIENICNLFDVSVVDIFSKKRNEKFVEVRMYIYFYFFKNKKYSYTKIAKMFSYHHSSIMNGVKVLENNCLYSDIYKENINKIFRMFNEKPFFENTLDVIFYRNLIKRLITEEMLVFSKLNISKKDKNRIFKDLKLTEAELENIKQYEWKQNK